MLGSNKVIWKEGLFLQPQHFQLTERNLAGFVNSRFAALSPHGYGYTSLSLSSEALANGSVAITQTQGVMPDGTPFDIPNRDTAPPARPIADHFAHDQQTVDVYLAIPQPLEGRAVVAGAGQGGGNQARYTSQVISVVDEVRGTQRKDIEVGGLNFQLLFEDESRDNTAAMPIAKIVRSASGAVEFSENFVPPLLHINASPYIMNQVRSLLEVLLAKNASLSQGRKQQTTGLAEFRGSDETAFRLLQTINTFTPLLNYYHFAPTIHPYDLFTLMTQFAGSLCTFSSDVTISQLPRYEHLALGTVFGAFNQIVRAVLDVDLSAGCVNVPIEESGPSTYVCKVPDERLLSTASFYFGLTAGVPEKELVVGALQRIKMCSRDRLELLIPSAMPGLPLVNTVMPPEGLSTKPGYIYFALDQKSEFWEGIKTSGSIAFYFPNEYPELRMEMLALRK